MKRNNDFIVGLTVLFGVVAIIAATLWVKQADLRDRNERVTARFRDVGNVRVGAAVVLRGVRAGRVESIELARDGWVQVAMALDPEVQLPRDPVVLLNESSLFGEWQATITEEAAIPRDEVVARQLAEARQAGGGALPGATLPDIAQLTAVAGRIAGDVASVAGRFEVAFDDQAARELRSSIQNFATLSAALSRTVRQQSTNLDALSADMRRGMRRLADAAESVQQVAERVDSSTATGQVRHIVDDVATAAATLKEMSEEMRAMSRQLTRSQGRLDSVLQTTDSVMMKINSGQGSVGLLMNDPTLYRQSDSLVVELRALVADFRANPKKYVNLSIF
ncbi:MAG TPA: MlaD family protein [Gemmatimonadaceae bacterium]|jgi:phospholipid/cholesterol/gamma-HCH transport system substrate-binding protein|nr:MlaD family protein [Gemmatimonadaceae bacterium]